MRTFVIILILYGNTLAPWLCCCAVSRASASLAVESPVPAPAKPACTAKCCQENPTSLPDASNHSPKSHHPCPVQEQLLLERPSANLERTELDIQTYFAEMGQHVECVIDVVSPVGSIAIPDNGRVPTLRMAELRLKYHHAYRC